MQRLHPETLHRLAGSVATPDYDRTGTGVGIVHIGVGAFHRAHQAVYTDTALALSGGDWGIIGVSLRSTQTAGQLNPQDGLYSVSTEDGSGLSLRVIGSIQSVLAAPVEREAVLDALARPAVHVVTLTITEKGYCALPGGGLNLEDPAVLSDLADPQQPQTAVGWLALGLHRRFEKGAAPLTVISCDNLMGNSRIMRRVLREYLERTWPPLVPWLDESVRFPCTMVDRIVPASTEAQRLRQSQQLGLADAAAVATEPFSQWLIEDDFAGPRPDWVAAGARLVDDIAPYEQLKLRLLNAGHSAVAYCGLLAELETVDEVMRDTALGSFVKRLLIGALLPLVDCPRGFDGRGYCEQLLLRFRNPCLQHRCRQIAMDGSEKIAQRWVPALNGEAPAALIVAAAAWCSFVLYTELPLEDPRAQQLQQLRDSAEPLERRIAGLLHCVGAGDRRDHQARLVQLLADVVDRIEEQGIRRVCASL